MQTDLTFKQGCSETAKIGEERKFFYRFFKNIKFPIIEGYSPPRPPLWASLHLKKKLENA
jgi:hypothetical protein